MVARIDASPGPVCDRMPTPPASVALAITSPARALISPGFAATTICSPASGCASSVFSADLSSAADSPSIDGGGFCFRQPAAPPASRATAAPRGRKLRIRMNGLTEL